ncbi:enoyl-CoA hydratase/isomerase family protein [Rhodococcus cerastii]|nr:enoyl-CoA hydratase/isomerase family protein [Rhodococcus cerastii]
MPYMQRVGEVFVLNLGVAEVADTENRFHPQWLDEIDILLDEVERSVGPAALVTTATGKYYSTGADVSWGLDNLEHMNAFVARMHQLLARLLTFPVPTVAALQGHTFGAAAFWAMAHDHRIMRSDRGYLCFPGVHIGVAYSPGTVAMLAARVSPDAFHEVLTTGRRYSGEQAWELGLVQATADPDELLDHAIERGIAVAATRGSVLGEIKRTMYARQVSALQRPVTGVPAQEWTTRGPGITPPPHTSHP